MNKYYPLISCAAPVFSNLYFTPDFLILPPYPDYLCKKIMQH